MSFYQIVAVSQVGTRSFEARIAGPGTPDSGVCYWFGQREEIQPFVDNLNLAYLEAERFRAMRRTRKGTALQARSRVSVRAAHAAC